MKLKFTLHQKQAPVKHQQSVKLVWPKDAQTITNYYVVQRILQVQLIMHSNF